MIKKYGYYCIVLLLVIALGGLYIYDRQSVPVSRSDTTKTSPKTATTNNEKKQVTVNCIGDSLTLGNGKTSYPSALAAKGFIVNKYGASQDCLLYTSPSPRDKRGSRMPSSA